MPATPHTCTRCGQTATGRYLLLGGQICNTCYSSLRRNPKPCPSCTEIRVLAFIDDKGQITCASCAGQPRRFACRSRGSEQFLTGTHCGHCRLDQRLQELLDNHGSTLPPLALLRSYLTAAPMDPRSIVRWLRREPIARTLRGMATNTLPISHLTIDQLEPGPRTRYFRRLLIDAGTLPPIPVLLHELNIFVDTAAAQLPTKHAPVLRRFHRWEVLPQLHRRYRDQGVDITTGVFTTQRSATLVRARFLDWVSEQDLALTDLDQSTLDYYMARVKARVTINQFIGWAARSHLADDLVTHSQPVRAAPSTYSEGELWEDTHQLLRTDTVELPVRIIGLFALIYAQPLDHSVRLTRDDLQTRGNSLMVAFGPTPVQLPEPVADLVRQHLAAPARRGFATGTSRWLFEGIMPGQHLSAAYARLRLTDNGIHSRHARETQLDLLARQLPASIVADTLGVTLHTAEQRRGRAGGIWSSYPALRD
ncbi:hypothetical protein DEU34_1353 [Microbacterium sp. AG1240]|uniref:hypothetical protein n=1 Tax=Microbacterium sp. AG1240 TaxID=2183992 RepID=UPI000F2D0373|nr:hypothetical protein [Microbacterium sp. AG1240]RKT36826.1 hypothetical protein DEU34_1353 [Microbacterium sp. AG1240]